MSYETTRWRFSRASGMLRTSPLLSGEGLGVRFKNRIDQRMPLKFVTNVFLPSEISERQHGLKKLCCSPEIQRAIFGTREAQVTQMDSICLCYGRAVFFNAESLTGMPTHACFSFLPKTLVERKQSKPAGNTELVICGFDTGERSARPTQPPN